MSYLHSRAFWRGVGGVNTAPCVSLGAWMVGLAEHVCVCASPSCCTRECWPASPYPTRVSCGWVVSQYRLAARASPALTQYFPDASTSAVSLPDFSHRHRHPPALPYPTHPIPAPALPPSRKPKKRKKTADKIRKFLKPQTRHRTAPSRGNAKYRRACTGAEGRPVGLGRSLPPGKLKTAVRHRMGRLPRRPVHGTPSPARPGRATTISAYLRLSQEV